MTLGPAPVLALLLGVLHVSVYVFIRGSAGQRLPWLLAAAFLGAWAGDALGSRLGIEVLMVGDFHVIVASVLAWVGILGVAIIAILGRRAPRETAPGQRATTSMSIVRPPAARGLADSPPPDIADRAGEQEDRP